jgi:hypothetical protein
MHHSGADESDSEQQRSESDWRGHEALLWPFGCTAVATEGYPGENTHRAAGTAELTGGATQF